ncbi:MAG TPA: gluconate 2-dehydrogenase subunit 3 family protein [Candidatus Acidoferrum sp.]|nr:gluconate 2-dehydrogenase subunit 3 family protein [Candidatus Acidoferrum sp.]
MTDKNDFRETTDVANASETISRRAAARMLLGSVSAGAIFPWASTTHPVWGHLADEALMNDVEASGEKGSPHFLDLEQFAALEAIAEAVVPGSMKARVAQFIDLLLSADTPKSRDEFVTALNAVERESTARYSATFVALTPAQKTELLTAISSGEEKASETKSSAAAGFANLKEWVVGAYYSSEMGMRELGWEPSRFFAEFPGCAHAEGHP